MPQLRLLLCCLALLFLAAPAMAEEDELAPGFDRCMEQSGGVTMEMMGCFQQAYDYCLFARQDFKIFYKFTLA